MRTINLITGGTVLGLLGLSAALLLPTTDSVAQEAGQPAHITLTGKIRDFPPGSVHVDFQVNPSATPGARSCNNVNFVLDAEMKPSVKLVNGQRVGKRINKEWRDNANRKIAPCVYNAAYGDNAGTYVNGQNGNDNGGIYSPESFAQWFRDIPGVNMSRLWTINLDWNSAGYYEYDTPNFNPVDYQLFGNGFDEHNFYFTYEIVAAFTAAAGQWLEFKGDDDCWVFIVGPGYAQGKLLLDHGGIAANREQYIGLDRLLPAHGGSMQVGQEYKLYIFFAERCQPQSQFRLRTNIGSLKTAGDNSIFAAFD